MSKKITEAKKIAGQIKIDRTAQCVEWGVREIGMYSYEGENTWIFRFSTFIDLRAAVQLLRDAFTCKKFACVKIAANGSIIAQFDSDKFYAHELPEEKLKEWYASHIVSLNIAQAEVSYPLSHEEIHTLAEQIKNKLKL